MMPKDSARALGSGLSVPSTEAPQLPSTEALISAFLKRSLRIDRVDLDQHFVDLGGDSLLAVQLAMRLSEELGTDLSPMLPFEAGSIRELTQLVEAAVHNNSTCAPTS
jgi:acyl carrier protein